MNSSGFRWLIALAVAIALFAGGAWVGKRLVTQRGTHAQVAENRQLWTCGMHPQVIQDHPGECPICHMELTPLRADVPATQSASGGDTVVRIDPVVVQNIGVRTARAQKHPITRRLRVVGYLMEPEPDHRDINLRVSGWIEKLYANIDGMSVKKGQKLFDLYSPEIRGAVEEMIAARMAVARKTGNAQSLALLQEGVARKLELMGLSKDQVNELGAMDEAPATVPILAPMSGHVTQKNVYEGAAVKSGDLVMRLASRDNMWVDAQVYETQLAMFRIGDRATATVVSLPGRQFEGTVVFMHPHLDAMTRTARIRIEIPNEDHLLHEGMYATLEIESSSSDPVVVVPREAIIDTGTRQIAFIAHNGGTFEPRELKLGVSGQTGVQVLGGIEEGENIVVSGQFLIDSESRLKEAIQKHLEHGGAIARAEPKQAPATGPIPVFVVPHLNEIVSAYLKLAEELGQRQAHETPIDAQQLLGAARQASSHGDADARSLVQPIIDAADTLKDKPLAEQRKLFKPLSTAVINLVDRSRPSQTLFVAHCPMAIDDAGANWLQTNEQIANPYFATQMKSCGEIRRTIDRQD